MENKSKINEKLNPPPGLALWFNPVAVETDSNTGTEADAGRLWPR